MNMKALARKFLFSALLCIACSTAAADIEKQVSGLWYYTGLTTDSGEHPLTGVFLFKDGIFMQQAIFDGENFYTSRSMAHAGPFQAFDTHVHLVAEQTMSTTPDREAKLSFTANTEHDVTVARDGDKMRLQFNMGTGITQDFKYVGPGEGELYKLDDGALAFVDDHFVLVQGNADGIVTGYGTYKKHRHDRVVLKVIRWTEGSAGKVTNLRDVSLEARFDGKKLTLPHGHVFEIRGCLSRGKCTRSL